MSDKQDLNYPDVLGFLTDEPRHNVGPAQVALALRPRVARAGRPFEVIMVIQNTVDKPIDVTVSLQIPDKDVANKKDRFLVGTERLVVGVDAAEVGYVMLPMSTLPDTAPSQEYMIAMDISVKMLEKGQRVRDADGGGEFKPRSLPAAKQQLLKDIYKLKYSTKKRGFLRSNTLEIALPILPGKIGAHDLDLKPGWYSLWRLENQQDHELLIERYREVVEHRVLPALQRRKFYKPIMEKTQATFEAAGYPLNPIEAACITRLMVLILEYANPKTAQGVSDAGIYSIESHLRPRDPDLANDPVPLPYWLIKLLRAIAHDERVGNVPLKAILHFAYKDLMYDAMIHAFSLIERHTGEDLGTSEEMAAYTESMLEAIFDKKTANFSTAYMPLIIGGILIYDLVTTADEPLNEGLEDMKHMLDDRMGERVDANDLIFNIADRVVKQSLRKYGSLDNRL